MPKLYPKIYKLCAAVGIDRGTFKNHYEQDQEFRARFDECKEMLIDDIEGVRFREAKKTKGVMDRMATLNAHRKEVYDPDRTLRVEVGMTREDAAKRAANLANVIDTEAVESYHHYRHQKRLDRERAAREQGA